MWRRALSLRLKTLAAAAASSSSRRSCSSTASRFNRSFIFPSPSASLFARSFSVESGGAVKKVEDVMPIATGHEREELESELKGVRLLDDFDKPEGPFGTKEAPAVIKSYYDRRIVGCPGGEGEDEHDVVWFWLEKDKPHECPVCSQHFVLEVAGPGGDPEGGHGDEHHH